MSNRIVFFDSISGIKYPEMLVDFFDQFIALKQLVQDCGTITVDSYTESSISFFISFNDISNPNKDPRPNWASKLGKINATIVSP